MSSDLPHIEQNLSYVVDDGEAVGPLPLTEIARSIAAGERQEDAYIWWSGAQDWVLFKSNPELVAMLATAQEALAAAEQPAEVIQEVVEVEGPAEPVVVAENMALTSVSARLNALVSSTRRAQASGHPSVTTAGQFAELEEALHPTRTSEALDLREPGDSDFDSMVQQTWSYERLGEHSARARELLAQACVLAMAARGFSVERRTSSHGKYFAVFDSVGDSRSLRLEIRPALSVSGSSSQRVRVAMSLGRKVDDVAGALDVVQGQLPTGERSTGEISSDIELDTCCVSTRVELVWRVDDYVVNDLVMNEPQLDRALNAVYEALDQRWHELFASAD